MADPVNLVFHWIQYPPPNGVFRGVAVTPEDRWIVFRYRPMSFVLGAILSLLGLAAVLGAAFTGSAEKPFVRSFRAER